jgi:hypothetical protein
MNYLQGSERLVLLPKTSESPPAKADRGRSSLRAPKRNMLEYLSTGAQPTHRPRPGSAGVVTGKFSAVVLVVIVRRLFGTALLAAEFVGCSGSAMPAEGSGGSTAGVGGGSAGTSSAQGGTHTGGLAGTGGSVDCGCVRGAYVPVCGVDGQTYDATCGDACVPVAIQCRTQCPCAAGTGGTAGTGGSTGTSTDYCGGCAADQICVFQVGGPGPSHYVCATNAACTLSGACACIVGQGTCAPVPTPAGVGLVCQCDNGLD